MAKHIHLNYPPTNWNSTSLKWNLSFCLPNQLHLESSVFFPHTLWGFPHSINHQVLPSFLPHGASFPCISTATPYTPLGKHSNRSLFLSFSSLQTPINPAQYSQMIPSKVHLFFCIIDLSPHIQEDSVSKQDQVQTLYSILWQVHRIWP